MSTPIAPKTPIGVLHFTPFTPHSVSYIGNGVRSDTGFGVIKSVNTGVKFPE